jgi:hypothetical protein
MLIGDVERLIEDCYQRVENARTYEMLLDPRTSAIRPPLGGNAQGPNLSPR